MKSAGRVAIGSFVMRGHEYLVAIVADNGVLRADTLRYADEIRTPEGIGLPKAAKAPARKVSQLVKEIEELTRRDLDVAELADEDAKALEKLVEAKQKEGDAVIHPSGMEEADDSEAASGGAEVIDLMDRLRKSLSKNVRVTTADAGPPIDLAEHRARRITSSAKAPPTARTATMRRTARKRPRRT
jgi:DNA end-binding protein Ku